MKDRKIPVSILLAALVAAAAFLAACSGGTEQASTSETPSAAAPPPPAAAPPPPAPASSDTGRQIHVPGAVFTLPEGWTPVPPSSPMRLAQAQIPGSAGPGELTVFHFGAGGGGGTEANLQRWIGQMEAAGEPTRDSFTLGTWKVTWIDVAGTLKPSSMGVGPTEPQPNSRLLGAVVEGEGGPWFFKATGPAETLDAQRDAFLDLLKSGRPSP